MPGRLIEHQTAPALDFAALQEKQQYISVHKCACFESDSTQLVSPSKLLQHAQMNQQHKPRWPQMSQFPEVTLHKRINASYQMAQHSQIG